MIFKTLFLACKEIQSVHPKGDQSWVFIGGTDIEAETPILWPPDAKSWLIWKDPDGGKDWGQKEKGMTEDEVVRWHHQLNGRVWVSSGSWWWTGRPGVLRFMWSQRVGHDWATELNWNIISFALLLIYFPSLHLYLSYINVNLSRYLESTNVVIEIVLYLNYSQGNKRPDSILSLKLHQLKSNVRLELCYQSFVVFIKHAEI